MVVRIYDAELSQGVTLWPDERPWEWLMRKKRLMPDVMYRAQYRNDPSGLRGVRYDLTWLRFFTPNTLPKLSSLIGVQGGDLATSERSTANYFGHCTGARDSDTGLIYILDFAYGHIPAPSHLEFLRTQYQMWSGMGLPIRTVLLEEVGPQQGTTQNLAAQTRVDPEGSIPIEVVNTSGTIKSKEQRFDAMMPFIKSGTVLFRGEPQANGDVEVSKSDGYVEFQREYSRFPRGGRDDVLDALEVVVNELVTTTASAAVTSDPVDAPREDERSEEEKRKARAEEYDRKQKDREQVFSTGEGGATARDRVLTAAKTRRGIFH
jgi:hypothetical protein